MAWIEYLLELRDIANAGEAITASSLSERTGIPAGVASAWLGKFVRWGYVVRSGSASGEKRWVRVYELTKWGHKYDPKYSQRKPVPRKVAANPKKGSTE
jgi:DNA-binding IclR family transcriptional regulator